MCPCSWPPSAPTLAKATSYSSPRERIDPRIVRYARPQRRPSCLSTDLPHGTAASFGWMRATVAGDATAATGDLTANDDDDDADADAAAGAADVPHYSLRQPRRTLPASS